jgi:tryptophanyl-tRNA synthetase
MESILDSIKKLLGISDEYTQFDNDIIMHINTVFINLTQLGVGPAAGFFIEDNSAVWTDFVDLENEIQLNAVKTYMYLKVKLLFDPPLSSSVVQSMNNMISELEWRLNAVVDFKD